MTKNISKKNLNYSKSENEILDGILILVLFIFLNFAILKTTYPLKFLAVVIELFIVFVLAIILEEVILNLKKAHFWILITALYIIFIVTFFYMIANNWIQIILLFVTTYLLLHRFNREVKKRKSKK